MSDVEDVVVNVLQHYGVKGMHWGVRKSVSTSARTLSTRARGLKGEIKQDLAERRSSETTIRAKPGSHVQVVGGTRRLPHEDAIKARVAEQIAKKNTLDALSNPELQHLVNRMNLESQYRNLATNETRATSGEKMAKELLAKHGDKVASKLGPIAGPTALKLANGLGVNKGMSGGTVKDKKKDKNK